MIVSLQLSNFQRFAEAYVDFSEGLIRIKGKNTYNPLNGENRTGQSTILRAITWALTGVLPGIGKNSISSTITPFTLKAGKTVVKLILTNTKGQVVEITRTLAKSSTLEVSVDGVKIASAQAYLDTLVGAEGKLFFKTTHFRPRDKLLVDESTAELVETMTSLVDTSELDMAASRVSAYADKLKDAIGRKRLDVATLEGQLTGMSASQEGLFQADLTVGNYEASKKDAADRYTLSKDRLTAESDQAMDVLQKARRVCDSISADITSLKTEIAGLEKQYRIATNATICPTCLQPLDVAHEQKLRAENTAKLEKLQQQLKGKEADLAQANKHQAASLQKHEATRIAIAKLDAEYEASMRVINSEYQMAKDLLERKTGDTTAVKARLADLRASIETQTHQLSVAEEAKGNVYKQLRDAMFQDTFASIVTEAGKVLSDLGSDFSLAFNSKVSSGRITYSVELKSALHNKSLSFAQLTSDGESSEVKLAIFLALNKVVGNPYQFILMDEPFGHMSLTMTEKVLSYIRKQGLQVILTDYHIPEDAPDQIIITEAVAENRSELR